MPSGSFPKAARAAVFIAFVIAFVCGVSVNSGPIVLLAFSAVALLAGVGIMMRRVWSAFGFALLLGLSTVAKLFFALTGQNVGSVGQLLFSVVLYVGIAGLFVLAGLSLKVDGAKMGSPIPWVVIALILSIPFVYFPSVSITSKAMESTLLLGDIVLVDRFAAVHDGDLVAFRDPRNGAQIDIRRVAGMPGEKTANGETVPANSLYVLGDNKDHSVDSRTFGFVSMSAVVGKPKYIYDSLVPDAADVNAQGDLMTPAHPQVRRWDRLFKAL